MHKILPEDNIKNSIESQRILNPIMRDLVKKEIIKWLDAGIICLISDSVWVSPIQCVLKKGGMTINENEKSELIPKRIVTSWRICMDYRKLNTATRKDHSHIPIIHQMMDRLAGKEFYYFLDGYSGYNQITTVLEDQKRTTFRCPYGTFAFIRMPFGLCNALTTFQRCMMTIFSDLIDCSMQVFMDVFSVFRESFRKCLDKLEMTITRCEENNLVLSWEKCHFIVNEGIVLEDKVLKVGLEVDQAKL